MAMTDDTSRGREAQAAKALWFAALAGWLAQVMIVWIGVILLWQVASAMLEVPPPAMLNVHWFYLILGIASRLVLITLPWIALFGVIMTVLEREEERPLRIWAAAGLGAAVPVMLVQLYWFQSEPLPDSLIPLPLLAVPAYVGGAIARRVRYPKGRPR